MNIFEYASRHKLRFEYKGVIRTEDLWDLPVGELDKIYKDLNSKLKMEEEESLLDVPKYEDEALKVRIDLVKFVVKDKLEAAEKKKRAAEAKVKRQKLLEILEEKENEEYKQYSADDIRKMLKDLE